MQTYLLKRLFDITVSLSLLVATSPFLILGIILAACNGGMPFFLQKRLGVNCKEFTIYKLRTMKSPPADAAPVDIMPDSPELTRIGRFLRNSCIDELPQLINVLKGDMSIVGPRPHPKKHAERYVSMDERYYQRYTTRPGLVCMVQVTALRYLTQTAEGLKARTSSDLDYIKNISLLLDLKILFKAACYVLTLSAYKTAPQNNVITMPAQPVVFARKAAPVILPYPQYTKKNIYKPQSAHPNYSEK